MPKNQLHFGKFKISERKRDGKNPRTIFYLTPIDEKHSNIEDYSQKYLIAIRRGITIERYPECLPNSLSEADKLSIIDHLKQRSTQLQNSNYKEPTGSDKVADFDILEDILV